MMSAELAIKAMLDAHAPLTAIVPATKIFAGLIPINTALPAVAYNFISGVRPKSIGMTTQMTMSRIQVTVQAKTYAQQKQLIKLVRNACDAKQGPFGGTDVDSCMVEIEGPDQRDDDSSIFMQTVDFMVKWSE
jgi:hypothetical protein